MVFTMFNKFFRAGSSVYPTNLITELDARYLASEGYVTVSLSGKRDNLTVRGDDAVDLVMLVDPSLIEGKAMTYSARAWTLHNMVGHPCMHALTLLGWHRMSKYVHDRTLPRPVGALDLTGLKNEV